MHSEQVFAGFLMIFKKSCDDEGANPQNVHTFVTTQILPGSSHQRRELTGLAVHTAVAGHLPQVQASVLNGGICSVPNNKSEI